MNDKQKLASTGAQCRLTEEQAKALAERMPQAGVVQVLDDEPMCMAKRIEELEAQLEKLTNRLSWRNAGSPNGLRRFMTHKQYAAQTPGVQKWYEPIRYEVPEGWQLVPVGPTENMCEAGAVVPVKNRQSEAAWIGDIYRAMLAAAPKPEEK